MQFVASTPTWSPAFTPGVQQGVGEAGRPLVELPVGDLAALVDDRDPVGNLVGGQLEEVREVVVPLHVCHSARR